MMDIFSLRLQMYYTDRYVFIAVLLLMLAVTIVLETEIFWILG
jgi:hypothetical protein